MVLGIIQELDKMKHPNYPLLAKQTWNPYVTMSQVFDQAHVPLNDTFRVDVRVTDVVPPAPINILAHFGNTTKGEISSRGSLFCF